MTTFFIITTILLAFVAWRQRLTIDLARGAALAAKAEARHYQREAARKQKLIDQYDTQRDELLAENAKLERRNIYLEEMQDRIDGVRARVNGEMERMA